MQHIYKKFFPDVLWLYEFAPDVLVFAHDNRLIAYVSGYLLG